VKGYLKLLCNIVRHSTITFYNKSDANLNNNQASRPEDANLQMQYLGQIEARSYVENSVPDKDHFF
jgi:hypothetical protein